MIDRDGNQTGFGDSLHYDADELMALGEAYAASLSSYIAAIQSPLPAPIVFYRLNPVPSDTLSKCGSNAT